MYSHESGWLTPQRIANKVDLRPKFARSHSTVAMRLLGSITILSGAATSWGLIHHRPHGARFAKKH